MGLNDVHSDYGSGSSRNSSQTWGSQELNWPTFQSRLRADQAQKSSSYVDLMSGRCTLQDVMQEFRMNGSDAPYNPDDDIWTAPSVAQASSVSYLRQSSWPAAERPSPRPLRPMSLAFDTQMTAAGSPPGPAVKQDVPVPSVPQLSQDTLTDEQRRILNTLSDTAVVTLLRELQRRNRKPDECRFCKNNGERESFYRSHTLRDGRGRVSCPVLRAFVCARCGATADSAHTIKYCPLATNEERIKSAAMMRSVRKASGRRRSMAPSMYAEDNYVYFGETPPSVIEDNNAYSALRERAPLDPHWAQLEQKLML